MFSLVFSVIAAALIAPTTFGQDLSDCITNCSTQALSAGGCTDL